MNPAEDVPLHERIVLVVDDIEAMRKVIGYQLRTLGVTQVLSANNGAEALRVLRRQRVDVVLSDWNMPVLSGLELLRALRADPELYAMPFVMVTAEAERQRVQEAIAGGVSDLLVKPYTTVALADRIAKALRRTPRPPSLAGAPLAVVPSAVPRAPQKTERSTVLVVDDTPDNLQLLSELLMDDYRVRVADNGTKALAICCSDTPPDLVLLDIMMPDMDGFEVARRMREHPSAEAIPVIFVSAMTGVDAQIKGLALGAVDFITKPVDPDLLRPRVRNFLRYVTLRKELQADYDAMLQLTHMREDVEQITRHDVKAPLAGILSLVQPLALEPGMNEDQRGRLRLLEELALQALNVVNLTTELYKIEAGSFVLQPQRVPLGHILRRVVALMESSFAGKQLRFEVAGDDALAAWGDTVFCYSILQNLVKNACEAAPEGGLVQLSLVDETPLRITITNAGAVPQAMRARFFDKFATAGKSGGSGIGTYSARLLTQAQGGDLSMQTWDAEDRTELTLRLPRAP